VNRSLAFHNTELTSFRLILFSFRRWISPFQAGRRQGLDRVRSDDVPAPGYLLSLVLSGLVVLTVHRNAVAQVGWK